MPNKKSKQKPLKYYKGFFIQETVKGYDLINPETGKHKLCKSLQAAHWWAGIMCNIKANYLVERTA